MVGLDQKEIYMGAEALQRKGVLTISYPMLPSASVNDTNSEDMSKVWHYLFYEDLQVLPEEHPVLITEAPLSPLRNREKIA